MLLQGVWVKNVTLIFLKVVLFIFSILLPPIEEEFRFGYGGYGQEIMSWSTFHLRSEAVWSTEMG